MRHYIIMPSELMLVAEAARALGVAAETLRRWVEVGKIDAQRTPTGFRIFRAEDVERLRKEREANGA